MEYDAVARNDEITQFIAIWMEQEDIMLNEISQKKLEIPMISLICGIHSHKTREYKVPKVNKPLALHYRNEDK